VSTAPVADRQLGGDRRRFLPRSPSSAASCDRPAPVTIGLTSLLIALIAAAMAGGRHRHLAAAAVAVAATGWLVRMIVCVITGRPLW
jgi:hypothetical protein